MNNIPKYFIDKVKKTDETGNLVVRNDELTYLYTLVNNGYIDVVNTDDEDTPENCHDFSIDILKSLD